MPFALISILTGILLLPHSVAAKGSVAPISDPVGYLLYYQPLFEFPQTQAQAYIVETRKILAQNHALDLEKIIATDGNSAQCRKPKGLACSSALYPKAKCVPRNKVPSQYCNLTSSNHPNDFFDESVFSRIEWNKLALQINTYCNLNKNPVCSVLAKLQKSYMEKYTQLIRAQREHRIKAMEDSR